MPSRNDLGAEPAPISTRAELLQRLENRETPANELNLTPDRGDALAINSQAADRNESRIEFLRARLDRASRRVETDHSFARLDGHARADFGRSR